MLPASTAALRLLGAACAALAVATPAPAAGETIWRDRLGLETTAPAVTPSSPLLAIIDTPVDLGHEDFAGVPITAASPLAPYDPHGTATASVAAGTGANGVFGVWPGMRVRSLPFGEDDGSCDRSASLIEQAVAEHAAVISMSYGSDVPCFSERFAVQNATRHGVVLVAAAGNDRLDSNPVMYPAAYPHVISVGALGPDDAPTDFSSSNHAPDVAAPGEDIPTAVPVAFDPDGVEDGWAVLTGTSFSAPMVAAAVAWLRAARPSLTPGQISAMLCASARDIPPAGWDRRTGCGGLDLGTALRLATPRPDAGEPNDDMLWVDGIAFGAPAPSVWRGGAPLALRASLVGGDDRVDVYRVLRPPHSVTRVSVTPRGGGADLAVLDGDAVSVADSGAVLARSRRPGAGIDRVTVANHRRRTRVAYVVVTYDARTAVQRTDYTLRVSRVAAR